jgi:[ribosomal protein S18]-alanine N-acetyltransferase
VQLQTFTGPAAGLVAGWAQSADEALKWCDVRAQLLWVDGVPVGYGELWLDAEENEVELARIIIAPERRRTGLGQTLVRNLVAQAVTAGYRDVFMRVRPDNAAALSSYRAAGFVPVATELAGSWNEAQPFDYVWLQFDAS